MRNLTVTVAAAAMLASTTAYAGNVVVEDALKNRPEFSNFYQGLVNTGVLSELRPDQTYTIFAPTNAAMARITPEKYPCFYSVDCRGEVADVLRNHIVPEQVTFNGPTNATVFSIDRAPVSIAEPNKNYFTADGHRILSQRQLAGGMLYTLDGIIASPQEMANLLTTRVIAVPVAVAPVSEPVATTTVTERVFYSPEGRPDGVSRTTVFNAADAYSAAPAR